MKRLTATLLTMLMAAAPIVASPADALKYLQNVKGNVTYGPDKTPTKALARNAQIAIDDNDYAATGANSEATIQLPDSSKILMGSNSNVQLVSFNRTDIANAKFVVLGKVRFDIQHPNGARANYTFQTGTGQIAVRGTVGDILANPNGLQVNVYALSNPALPVQVTLVNGQVFTLAAGQSLVATAVAGAVTASVTGVSQSLFTPFSELGAPANAGSLGISAASAGAGAGAAAAGTAAAAVGGAAIVTTAVVNSNKSPATPSPSASPTPTVAPTASPTPSSTSVPVTINSVPHAPSNGPNASNATAPAPHASLPLPMPPHSIMPTEPRGPGGRPSPRP